MPKAGRVWEQKVTTSEQSKVIKETVTFPLKLLPDIIFASM